MAVGAMRAAQAPLRIIGVDPGSQYTGWAVIETQGDTQRALAYGRIHCANGPLPQRLRQILDELGAIVAEHAPHESAIEEVYVRMNVGTALVLGQARGAAICALAGAALPVAEYSASRVKAAIVGSGRGDKLQVQTMVRMLLKLEDTPATDAADALAIALCHAQLRRAAALGQVVSSRRRGRSGLRYASLAELGR